MRYEITQSHFSYDDIECEELVTITYRSSSRYVLGTQAVSVDELDDIVRDIRCGKLIGLEVYAYVHSDAMIATSKTGNPFSCKFDSGLSGIAYMTREDAMKNFGKEGDMRLTSNIKGAAEKYIESVVRTFSAYLEGDVWDIVIYDDEDNVVDSCGGYVGSRFAEEQAQVMLNNCIRNNCPISKES